MPHTVSDVDQELLSAQLDAILSALTTQARPLLKLRLVLEVYDPALQRYRYMRGGTAKVALLVSAGATTRDQIVTLMGRLRRTVAGLGK